MWIDHRILSGGKGDKQGKIHTVCLHLHEIQNRAKEKLVTDLSMDEAMKKNKEVSIYKTGEFLSEGRSYDWGETWGNSRVLVLL